MLLMEKDMQSNFSLKKWIPLDLITGGDTLSCNYYQA